MEIPERDDENFDAEEKSDEMPPMPAPSPAPSDRSNGTTSPPPTCSICLGVLVNTSFTDSCLHQFCFSCLVSWSKIKTECPLCKQNFRSIIHNVRSEEDYDQYHIANNSQAAAAASAAASRNNVTADGQRESRTVADRTANYPRRSERAVLLNPEAVARREQIPSIARQVSSEEQSRRFSDILDYRRNVYSTGALAMPLTDRYGLFRQSNAHYYRINRLEVARLSVWLNRELHVLLDLHPQHFVYILNIILDALTLIDINSNEFRDLVRPYFGVYTDHFQHEFYNFARSSFDMTGYDQSVTYYSNQGSSNEDVSRALSPNSSSSNSISSDSEVQVVDHFIHSRRLLSNNAPSGGPQLIDVPGPSSIRQASNPEPDIVTILSSSSESENECEIVNYVWPQGKRTLVIIDLFSSDEDHNSELESVIEEVNETELVQPPEEILNLPSTSTSSGSRDVNSTRKRRYVPTYCMDSSSQSDNINDKTDSDYEPSRCKIRRGSRHNSSSRKTSRKLRSRKQSSNQSSSRNRRTDDSCRERELNASPMSSRGKKRRLSESTDIDTDNENCRKKFKKSTRSEKSRESERRCLQPSSSKARIYKYGSEDESSHAPNSDSDYDTEVENKNKSRRRVKKKTTTSGRHSNSNSSDDEYR